ncbi:serine/threonine-protein phosphatase 4 regulatory subunit 2 [Drosophila elegans]|uniref:serine/threonine-protein phosphatase 4 regulatory subunit 2 n=1 Tax=Drosophila elegans TaxID=30023 RepID=UPI0007E84B5A|nr:serine/threonine-protein phosphatase 4 regulatory subunit 2 [Drosophila elegans]
MHNLIKSRALLEILKSPVQDLDFIKEIQVENENKSGKLAVTSTVKLNVNAQEFVPRFKTEESSKDEAEVVTNEIKKTFETLDEQNTNTNLMLPWKGFPKKAETSTRNTRIVWFNDADYIIRPCAKRTKKSKDEKPLVDMVEHPDPKETLPSTSTNSNKNAEEKRREKERKVAVEALKLAEQRRMRAPLVPSTPANENCNDGQPVVHLSRSPIRFSPEERIRVDSLRAAKRERIERVLREMTNEKQEQLDKLEKLEKLEQQEKLQQEKQISHDPMNHVPIQKETEKKEAVALVRKNRYIPTTKEWDERCRAKQMAKMEAEKKDSKDSSSSKANSVNPSLVEITSSGVIRLGDLRAVAKPRYCPPGELMETEKRKGNLTHFRPLSNWTSRQNPHTTLNTISNHKGKIVQRYSIEQLLEFEPQPGDLTKPILDEAVYHLGFLCI